MARGGVESGPPSPLKKKGKKVCFRVYSVYNIVRGVVEAIRAHTAYGYLFYLLESVWVVIEDATMQLYGAVWPVVFDFKKRPYGMGGVYQELGGAKHPHGGSKV